MSQIQEINWNNFKTKFNGKEQKSFELLCYLMFCEEFNQDTGIFRYKNQAGIETEPIYFDNQWIGFQAKFYETKISDNKEDIKDSITKGKTNNPNLSKILFYINQEFSESSQKGQKEPKYKLEIENHAKSIGVEITWRVPSHFEKQLSSDKNLNIAQRFFSLDRGIADFIQELEHHTESILAPINSDINFNGNVIKLDRSNAINQIKSILLQSSVVVISGEGGAGKTAVIKDYYRKVKESVPFFVFKATEFNVSNINSLFKHYGDFTFLDFLVEHQNIDTKCIVIDSAEKISDIEDQEIFHEFLFMLLNKNWKIIFTARHSYLDDLKFQFVEIYHINFQVINVEKLNTTELIGFSEKYGFDLPDSVRLLELLQTPFYLNEYLFNLQGAKGMKSFSDFRNTLWNKRILNSAYRTNNSHIRREECFLKIAQKRVNDGHFFVQANGCDDEILQSLEEDEIIKYDSNAGGYFITHDIYEEWALDKIIERGFHNSENYKSFLNAIGSSLPTRRAFRNWLSEKLLINQNEVLSLIKEAIDSDTLESFWKDEILVSVLLSNYSEVFIQLFEEKLLEDNQKLLMRIVFLLRIACKEIDESFLNLLGLRKTDGIALMTLFMPKGSGWSNVIDFIYRHKEDFGLINIDIILPLLNDWNNKNKNGETTKKVSLIALYYYEEIVKNENLRYSSRGKKIEKLISVILQGASEIKRELSIIFGEAISKKQTSHQDKYYQLIQIVLTSITECAEVVKCLPEQVLALADLFWFHSPTKKGRHSRMDVEDCFCISSGHLDYFPSSAFQTPVFQLLRFSPKETIDFILSFTNKTVECYANSNFDGVIEKARVFIDDVQVIEQYISDRLWNMYRGTQISTHLLESMHMALERWLLEYAKNAPQEEIERICKHLIKNSTSASITAVVVSVVLANAQKLFNIAKILFQTKEFFHYDTGRMGLDRVGKIYFGFGYGLNYHDKIYEDERIKTCEDIHRKFSLENLALNYQVFRIGDETENDVENRQRIIWNIFDSYYEKLPDKAKEIKSDKTWRLCLARMDRRKMNLEMEEKDGQALIKFNPEIDPELKKYSDDSVQRISETMKYTSLQLWSEFRFKREEDKYKQYEQYETNLKLVITETREILDGLKKKTDDNSFFFNRATLANVCSVLVRDYFDDLTVEEKALCKEVIMEFASIPLHDGYYYQISDGTEPSIFILPELLKKFSKDKKKIKSLLFLLLLNPQKDISTFAVSGILNNLWEINFEDAHSIFLGYLFLAPKYNELRNKIRQDNYKKGVKKTGNQVAEVFFKRHKNQLQKIVSNKITYGDLHNLDKLDLEILKTAFELLPLRTNNVDHKNYVNTIFPILSKKLFSDNDRIDYTLKQRFLEKFAYFVLTSTKGDIETYLKPFLENFSSSRDMADFFQGFISAEDRLNQYEEFWIVWSVFYDKIVEMCKNINSNHYAKEIMHNYLLAWPYWKEDAKKWHTLKVREKLFFKKAAEDIGHYPPVLYAISKILNDIGSDFLEDGIMWISNIVQKNNNLLYEELEINTIFYVENIVRKYILTNRQKIKKTRKIKDDVISILNFLIEKGSATGYLFRENIL